VIATLYCSNTAAYFIEVTYFLALKQRKGHFISTYEKIGFINNANTYKMPSFKAIETGCV
jgi:hypothetical protein